jgi:cell shape-determining protein MreC
LILYYVTYCPFCRGYAAEHRVKIDCVLKQLERENEEEKRIKSMKQEQLKQIKDENAENQVKLQMKQIESEEDERKYGCFYKHV